MSVSLSCGLKVCEIYQISTLARKANTLQYVFMFLLFSLFMPYIVVFNTSVQNYKKHSVPPNLFFHTGTTTAQQRGRSAALWCDGARWSGRILRGCIRFRRLAACAPFGVRRWGGFYRMKLVYTVSSCCGRPWAERSAAMARRRKAMLRPRIRMHCMPSSSFKTSSALCPCTMFQ